MADALYSCVCMYVLGYQTTPPNLWVELARWTAPLATAGAAVLLLTTLQVRVRNLWCYLRGGSVAVYGPEEERQRKTAAFIYNLERLLQMEQGSMMEAVLPLFSDDSP